jgi:cytoskeletal protein CcmA (bactofilin family)
MTNFFTIKSFAVLIPITLLFVLMAQTVLANTVVRSGQTVSVAEGQSVAGDFYVAAGTINISGEVEEDALLLGGQVTVNGTINENAFIVGGNVDIHGTINDDLRIIGGEVTIAESIVGDLAIFGGSVNILSSASIGGDLLIYGADVAIEGSIEGDLLGTVGTLRVDSYVGGDIDVRVTNLVLGDQANLAGNLTYDSFNNLERSLNATVSGEVLRNDPVVALSEGKELNFLIPSLIVLFSILSWYLFSKKTLNKVVNKALVRSPKPALIGFAVLFLAPIAALMLTLTIIGSMLGLAILFAYSLIIVLALIVMPAVLGQMLMLAFTKTDGRVNLLSILIGVLVITVLSQLPVLGLILFFVLLIIAIGSLVEIIYNSKNKAN